MCLGHITKVLQTITIPNHTVSIIRYGFHGELLHMQGPEWGIYSCQDSCSLWYVNSCSCTDLRNVKYDSWLISLVFPSQNSKNVNSENEWRWVTMSLLQHFMFSYKHEINWLICALHKQYHGAITCKQWQGIRKENANLQYEAWRSAYPCVSVGELNKGEWPSNCMLSTCPLLMCKGLFISTMCNLLD